MAPQEANPVEAAIAAVTEQLTAHAAVAATIGAPPDATERRSIERRLRDAVEGVLDALDAYGAAVREAHGATVPWVLPAMLSVERSLACDTNATSSHTGDAATLDVLGRWRYHVPDVAALERHAGMTDEVDLDDVLAVLLHRLGFADVDPLGHVPQELLLLDVADIQGRASSDVSRAPDGGYPTGELPPLGERPLTSVKIGVTAPARRPDDRREARRESLSHRRRSGGSTSW